MSVMVKHLLREHEGPGGLSPAEREDNGGKLPKIIQIMDFQISEVTNSNLISKILIQNSS